MSVVAVALVLGALVILLLRTSKLGLGSAVVCMLFGLVIAATPAGPSVHQALGLLRRLAVVAGECAVNRLGGSRREENPLRLNIARVHVPLSAVLAAWSARKIGSGVGWLLRHPLLLLALPAGWLVARLLNGHAIAAVLLLVLMLGSLLTAWRLVSHRSFTREVSWRVRGVWRGWRVYRFCWQPAMVTTNLAVRVDGEEYLPKILRITSTGSVDRVWARMLPGQVLEDWTRVGSRLAQTFGAKECRIRSTPRHRQQLELWFLIDDPLTEPVDPLPSEPGRTECRT